MKRIEGFSLVELAIVLVIIGLITGGILTGQDLIRASELNSFHTETNKFKMAINTFKLKYNALPGDIPNATAYWGAEPTCPPPNGDVQVTGACNGNGDGLLSAGASRELIMIWKHLSLAGLIPGNYIGRQASTAPSIRAGLNVPPLPWGTFLITSIITTPIASTYFLSGQLFLSYTLDSSNTITASFTPTDIASLDTKYDDGKPAFGKISTIYMTSNPNCTTSDTASAAEYRVSYTDKACNFIYFWW